MANSKTLVILAIFCILLMHELKSSAEAEQIDCKLKCGYRCSKTSRQKMCMRACNTCCQRCNCVPPGTSGNTHVCPCYANMKTHGGKLKCP
ncbi:gibberellin-regulated protein 2-like [Mercurialis annua]|uniref:gibberellin-regulated protein 2-like n=1 Tax=Mercurialis annua TaxID=3986 RepID=UPI00215E8BCF|nr:gibberellin-regulated protein 2-like [Mercurialis annua]